MRAGSTSMARYMKNSVPSSKNKITNIAGSTSPCGSHLSLVYSSALSVPCTRPTTSPMDMERTSARVPAPRWHR